MLPSTAPFQSFTSTTPPKTTMAAAEQASSATATPATAAAPERLLEVAEDEVVIDFKPNSKCRADLRLRSLHPSLPVAFKVQTSSPLKFLVSPPRGAVPPLSSSSLRVVLRPQPHAPPCFPRSRADRFLVLSALSAAHLDSAGASGGIDNNSSGVSAVRLLVFFGGPYLLRLAADAGDAAAVRLILRRQPHLLPVLEPQAAVLELPQSLALCGSNLASTPGHRARSLRLCRSADPTSRRPPSIHIHPSGSSTAAAISPPG